MKISPGGRCELFPDPSGLVEFITEMRVQERALTTTHIIKSVKRHQVEWLRIYLRDKQPGTSCNGLLRLLQRFCNRRGFSRQKAGKNKRTQDALIHVRDKFAEIFHRSYHAFAAAVIYNVDETGSYYDMPPKYIMELSKWRCKDCNRG